MPELPEVESTASFLRERIVGQAIESVSVLWQRTVVTHGPGDFERDLIGRKILNVTRRGKYLVIHLNPRPATPNYLLAHLRMSGSFDVLTGKVPRETHDRIVLSLKSGREVRFHDPRKFGKMYLVENIEEITGKLGIEPLDPKFTKDELVKRLKQHRGGIKPLLLRQDLVAGLGNIYVDEALWSAGIHPLQPACRISPDRYARLCRSIRRIITNAIDKAGTDFGDGVVEAGGYEPSVYGREKKSCRRCSSLIKRITVGQRGTHFCPKCQRRTR